MRTVADASVVSSTSATFSVPASVEAAPSSVWATAPVDGVRTGASLTAAIDRVTVAWSVCAPPVPVWPWSSTSTVSVAGPEASGVGV